jgi:hypothetical protein
MGNYKRKTVKKYSQEDLNEAIDHLNNKTMKKKEFINNLDCLRTRGRKPFLSEEIEKKLTEGCLSFVN